MCGITGSYRFDKAPVQQDLISRMNAILAHRGPDGEGTWYNGHIGLGHRRLKIIDLSERGHQPMTNEDGTLWLTYNGEIYNYIEIRNTLQSLGHRFKSKTDSEVILHAYETWGLQFLDRLNGMFAFALADTRKDRLLLVRDRLGIKPLFYHLNKDRIIFASEIKALLVDPMLEREIDIKGMDTFLAFNYLPAPQTLFRDIKQLLPGEYLLINNGKIKQHLYWKPSFEADPDMNQKDCDDTFKELFTLSVKRRLVSDVPFGAFLSGGIDSSSVVSVMAENIDAPLKTFSIDFKERNYSEVADARCLSDALGVEHYSLTVEIPTPETFTKMVWCAEEPTADASLIPMYFLSKFTRSYVSMALSGDGADELMGGYETYLATLLGCYYRRIPKVLRQRIITPLVNRIPTSLGKVSFDYKAKAFVRGSDLPSHESHYHWRIIFDETSKQSLYSTEFKKKLDGFKAFDVVSPYFAESKGTLLERLLEVDTRFYLPSDMLVKVDRSSMAHGLEVRVPFLDHKLVEFLSTIPPKLKFNYFMRGKSPLRRVMNNRLPKKNLRKKKKGFNAPIGLWFAGPLKDFVHEILSAKKIKETGFFCPKAVSGILKAHEEGRADNGYKIYSLIIFMLWREIFFKSDVPL